MSTMLEALVQCAPLLQRLFPEPCSITISNPHTFVAVFEHPQLPITIKAGDPVVQHDDTVTYKAVRTQQRVVERKSKEKLGYAYIAVSEPVFDESGTFSGVITVVLLTERQDTLRVHAHELSTLVEQLSANADSLSTTASQVAAANADMSKNATVIKERIQVTSAILSFIHELAAQSNLLGLNAAIEAARAGDLGKGFAVVADEIRRLAQRSQSASKEIEEKLSDIRLAIERMVSDIQISTKHTQEQARAVQELASSLNQIAKSAQELARLSNEDWN